ncbi:MFS transporter [Gluconobacter kanchanaburiensis]|uniref:Major facilitator superfamily (MFS) profile domain-containing protein n=1 Tax=Gluconobacter kanchanaburiensis NBRC 103587 TaxID=1307948 RepID=A0A511B8X1_9PROT|nr:MFS transporter [Gluconobacter kanchanaburiensis]MBF0862644.1 MFS transporter [Gluconobacter kanchanaburiensis]GEK96858.1 hypothetical protein GKA01_20550 [Gluconobacter kanchanaburiensis NBRC 103587]
MRACDVGVTSGSLVCVHLADRYSTRGSLVARLFFVAGALGTATAPSVSVMVVMRALLVSAVGGASALAPMFVS